MKKESPEKILKKLIESLNERYERWESLYKYGGSDPTWSDGCNMRLVRNHIISYKNQIKELCEEFNQPLPEIYHRELPPEVDNNYMARADEIRINAKKSLEIYKADENYKYLLLAVDSLNKRQRESTCIDNVIWYCKGLEQYIKDDDLAAMRRHEHYQRYLDSFKECRKRVEQLKIEPIVFVPQQISMFESIGV